MSNYPQPPYPPPKKTNPWPWIAGGCAVVIVGGLAFVGFIMAVVFGSMRATAPYREALERAQNDERVVAALGAPIKAGFFVTGTIKTQNAEGMANLSIPIRGPKGKARIYVAGYKESGRWRYTRMTVTPREGEPIDLLRGEWLRRPTPNV